MFNFFNSAKDTEDSAAKTSEILFVKPDFSVLSLQSVAEYYFKNIKKSNYAIKKMNKGFSIDYDIKKDEKKEIITATRLQLLENENCVFVNAETTTISLQDYTETNIPAKFNLKKNSVFKYLQKHVLSVVDDGLYALENKEHIAYIQDVNPFVKNYIFHLLHNDEVVLSILGISEIKVKAQNTIPKDANWYFILTATRTFLVGNTHYDFYVIDISKETLTLEKKTGKDLLKTEMLQFYTEYLNDGLYEALQPVWAETTHRTSKFADVLLKKYKKKSVQLTLISRLYALENTSLNVLKRDLIVLLPSLQIPKENHDAIKNIIATHSEVSTCFGDDLIRCMEDWNIANKTQHELLDLILQLDDNFTKHRLAYHRYIRTSFLETEKKEEARFEFNLTYAKQAVKAEAYQEALKVYKEIYDILPDDSIIDLLPTNTTNLLQGEGSPQLKLTILEAILMLEQKLGLSTDKTELYLAQLQPLLISRIKLLLDNPEIKEKANQITTLLEGETFSFESSIYSNQKYTPLEKENVLQDVVPHCFKDAKGFFDSLNGFIAALNPPDYEAVIAFSDKVSEQNYPNVFSSIANMAYALQLDVPECYIGRGKYASSVIGVEGKPSFLMIGIHFLEEDHPLYLKGKELQFLMAIELAHMYFEHSKITASDVWRGAAEKGFSVVSTLLTFLPFVGNIGALFGNVANVQKYLNVLKKVEKVASVAGTGKDIIEAGEKFDIDLLGRKTVNESNSQNLLITSRLMEIIADKVALLFCDDLKAAIHGILASSSHYETDKVIIEKYGLLTYLAQTDEQGEFSRQEISIRIKNVISFYLSDTYENLKTQLLVS